MWGWGYLFFISIFNLSFFFFNITNIISVFKYENVVFIVLYNIQFLSVILIKESFNFLFIYDLFQIINLICILYKIYHF